jgi:hypothetical protein
MVQLFIPCSVLKVACNFDEQIYQQGVKQKYPEV